MRISGSTIREWLEWLWRNESGLFGIGQGPSTQQEQQYGILSNVENYGISSGEKATGAAQNFWTSILSGDPTQISKVLGPQISSINKQNQQQKKTAAEFGNRSGGTNALMQTLDDRTLTSVRGLISGLTGTAAGELSSIGSSLLGTGLSAGSEATSEANLIQKENAAKWNDIFNSISQIVSGVGTGLGIKQGTTAGGIFGGIAGVGSA